MWKLCNSVKCYARADQDQLTCLRAQLQGKFIDSEALSNNPVQVHAMLATPFSLMLEFALKPLILNPMVTWCDALKSWR